MALKRGVVRTQVKVEGADSAKKQLDKVTRGLIESAVAAKKANSVAAQSSKSGLTAAGAIGGAMSGAVLAIQGAVDILQTFAQVSRQVGESLINLAQKGGRVSAVTQAFLNIGSPEIVENIHNLTGGLISNADIMTKYTQVMRVGLVTQSEFAEWMQVTTRAAQDMGMDVGSAIDAVVKGLSGGGMEEGFQRLGVNVTQIRETMSSMGLTMENAAGKSRALQMALAQMRDNLGQVSNSASNTGDGIQVVTVTFQNWIDDVARSFSENENLIQFFGKFNAAMEDTLPSGDRMAVVIVKVTEAMLLLADFSLKATQALITGFNGVVKTFDTLALANPLTWIYEPEFVTALRDMGVAAEEATDVMAASFDGASNALQQLTTESTQGTQQMIGSAIELGSTWTDLSNIGRTFEFLLSSTGLDDYGSKMERVHREIAEYEATIGTATSGTEQFIMSQEGMAAAARAVEEELRAEQRALSALAEVMASESDAIQDFYSGGTQGTRDPLHAQLDEGRPSRRGGGGGRQGPSRSQLEGAEQAREMRLLFADMDQDARSYDSMLEGINEQYDAQLVQLRLITAEMDERERAHERELAATDAEIANTERLAALAEKMKDDQAKAAEKRQSQIKGGMEIAAQGISLVGDTIGQAISIQEQQVQNTRAAMEAAGKSEAEIAKATKKQVDQIERLKKAEGAFLVAYNVVKAAIEIAEAIAAFAAEDYISGAMHILSAAAFGVAAGMAAARLGGGSASIPAAPSAGTKREKKTGDDTGGPAKVEGVRIVNVYSLGRSQGEIGEAMEKAQWERAKSARPNGGMEGIEYDA